MEALVDALEDIGRPKDPNIEEWIEGGPKSPEFTRLVAELSSELRTLRSLEESVSATESPDDASAFLLELSSFLKELECPHLGLISGHVSSRLRTVEDRLLLLDFLVSELMVARMRALDDSADRGSGMEVTVKESQTAKDLKDILIAFKFNKPPPEVTVDAVLSKVEAKLKEVVQKEGPDYVGRPLFNKAIPEKQWNEIRTFYDRLRDEYKMRREMLIARLDCTVRSFEWSDRGAKKREEIQSVYRPLRAALKYDTAVKLSDFLAARNTLLTIKKTSDASVRVNTKSQINKVIIGKVPDRGGRPSDQEPPPPEMPSWQKQRSQGSGFNRGGSRGGGRGGGSGFGGGSRVQGNWNPPKDRRDNVNEGFTSRNQNYDNRQGYQENRRNSYHDSTPNSNYQNKNYDSNYANQSTNQGYQQGYQNQYQGQHYQQVQGDYNSQNYQRQESQNMHSQGFQGRGKYQNEHDNRTDYQNNGNNTRGRSNYNRGGRY